MLGELEPRPAALQRLRLHVCPTHLCGSMGRTAGQRGWGSGSGAVSGAV